MYETDTVLGTGKTNTTAIVSWLNSNTNDTYGDVADKINRAAYLCDALIIDGYSDWFLPSKDELDKIYINLKSGTDENGAVYTAVGSFAADYYWSSSEVDANKAWSQSFSDGSRVSSLKTSTYRVRAIRKF